MKNATATSIYLKGFSALIAALALILSQQNGLATNPDNFTHTGSAGLWTTAGNWSNGTPSDLNFPVTVGATAAGQTANLANANGSAGDLIIGPTFSALVQVGSTTANSTLSVDSFAATGATGTITLGQNGATGTLHVQGGNAGHQATVEASGLILIGGDSNLGGGSGVLNVDTNGGSTTFEGSLVEANGGLTLDALSGQSAQLNVTGSGTGGGSIGTAFVSIGSGQNFIVGDSHTGTNTVTLTTGGFIDGTDSNETIIGNQVGSSGTVNVGTGVGDSAHMNANTLLVGDFGTGTLNVNGSSAVVYAFGDYAAVGYESGGIGTVSLTNGGAFTGAESPYAVTGLYIGDDGTGTFNVGTGVGDSGILTMDNITVGDSSTGTLNGNGSGSITYVTSGNVTVGTDGGTGFVNLTNGATLNALSNIGTPSTTTGIFLIGNDEGSSGTVAVGENSTDTAALHADSLIVGSYGTGTLNITGTGALTTVDTGNVNIGENTTLVTTLDVDNYTDGMGTVTITAGGTLNAESTTGTAGTFDIGKNGTGLVTVGTTSTDTAILDTDNLIVGDEGTGTLNITGTGALVTVSTGNVTVGNGIQGNAQTRFGQGNVFITEGGILDASAVGGVVTIGNNGESQDYDPTLNAVQVGDNSSTTDTATLKADTLVVGSTSVGNLFVSGANATVTVGTGNVTVGQQSGGDGQFSIYNDAVVDVTTLGGNGLVDLGRDTNSFGEIVLGEDNSFDGAGPGTLKMDSLVVGDSGTGYFDVYNGSTATVSNGAIIGDESGSYGDAFVEDTGSTLTVTTGDLKLGNKSGAEGYLTVENAGVVNVNGGDIKVGSLSGGFGGLEVNGTGSTVNGSGDLYVDNGYVEEFDHASIDLSGNTHLTVNGTFIGGGHSSITDDYFNAGLLYINNSPSTPDLTVFHINGNYVGQGGTIKFDVPLTGGHPFADLLVIDGNASGDSLVHINNFHNGGGGQTTGNGILLIDVDGGTNTGDYTLDSRVTAGAYDYNLAQVGQDLFLQSQISPEVVGAASIAATGQFLEAASLDTLQQRMGELNQSEAPAVQTASNDAKDVKDMKEIAAPTVSGPTSEVWSRGIYRYDNLHTGYGLTQDTEVGQIGGDYRFTGLTNLTDALYVGGLADYGQSSGRVTVQPVDLEGEDIGFGAYTTYVNGGFYADGVVKGNFSHYKVKTGFGDYGASGSGVAASLETGYGFNVCDGFMITPQAQVTYQYESYNKPTDSLGRVYDLNDPDYLQTRVGVQFDKSFTYSPGLHFTPYLRTGWLYQALGDNQTTVAGQTFTENTEGSSVEVDGGFTLDVCTNVAIYASGNSAWGDKDDSYGGTGGVKVSW